MFLLARGSSPLARGTYNSHGLGSRSARLIPARAGNMCVILDTIDPLAAHPRSRGEHSCAAKIASSLFGSSPLARGTYSFMSAAGLGTRLIPARAGNIGLDGELDPRDAAHPRSRGEHLPPGVLNRAVIGSSPLARGTSRDEVHSIGDDRLIPARAGNIYQRWGRRRCIPAHPRSRGEHSWVRAHDGERSGSSPLARGTCAAVTAHPAGERLIPARAGNICGVQPGCRPRPAHPRSRGEHFCATGYQSSSSGSSPLARGTCYGHDASSRPGRLIPARAGNISCAFLPARLAAAHPRSRGEHKAPRYVARPGGWLIPARAGNIRHSVAPLDASAAHPRSRGEHAAPILARRSPGGSSPLARGTCPA